MFWLRFVRRCDCHNFSGAIHMCAPAEGQDVDRITQALTSQSPCVISRQAGRSSTVLRHPRSGRVDGVTLVQKQA